MIVVIRRWFEHRSAIRRRWQADARRLAAAEGPNAYCRLAVKRKNAAVSLHVGI